MEVIVEKVLFFCFVGLTVIPAIIIVFSKQILYIAFALMLCFLGIAGLYVFAGAAHLDVIHANRSKSTESTFRHTGLL